MLMANDPDDDARMVTLTFFCVKMMGMTRNWYYERMKRGDPDLPPRLYFNGSRRPMLRYCDCLRYQRKAQENPPWKPRRRKKDDEEGDTPK